MFVCRHGTNLQCYASNTSNAQKFVLQRATYNGKEYEKPVDNKNGIASQRAHVISYMNEMATLNSASICRSNGIGMMKDAYRQLQPGDLVLASEHVMMVTEVGNDYVKVTHQTTYNSTLKR